MVVWSFRSIALGLIILGVVRTFHSQKLWQAGNEKIAAYQAESETTNYGRVIVNPQGQIVGWNKGMFLLTGLKSDDTVDKTLSIIASPDDKAFFDELSEPPGMMAVRDRSRRTVKTAGGGLTDVEVRVTDATDSKGLVHRRVTFFPVGPNGDTADDGT